MTNEHERAALATRWMKFNLVGAMGIAVQLAGVYLTRALSNASPTLATAFGVEMAVLHNFLWHEKFTWADRGGTGRRRRKLSRFLWFNGTTGAISIAGNVAAVLLVQWGTHLPVIAANFVAIAGCSIVNFIVNDRIVFRRRRFSSEDFPDMLAVENSKI